MVYSTMVSRLVAIMNGLTSSSPLVRAVMLTASRSSGTVPIQYLLHSMLRGSSGLDRSSHIWRPSSEMPGKMNRAATADRTNPASPG
jgi:hypothetical protein